MWAHTKIAKIVNKLTPPYKIIRLMKNILRENNAAEILVILNDCKSGCWTSSPKCKGASVNRTSNYISNAWRRVTTLGQNEPNTGIHTGLEQAQTMVEVPTRCGRTENPRAGAPKTLVQERTCRNRCIGGCFGVNFGFRKKKLLTSRKT